LSRLRVITSASVANFLFALLIGYLMALTITPFVDSVTVPTGVEITAVVPDFPAANAGITEGMTVVSIDNTTVDEITELVSVIGEYDPGDSMTITTDSGEFPVVLEADPNNSTRGYLGVYFEQKWDFSQQARDTYSLVVLNIIIFIFFSLSWIANLNMMVGIMNLLPLWVVDGGQMVSNILAYFLSENKVRRIVDFISYIVLMILLINIIGPYLF
jgi:membrane-associated protease RseP (regulator of RpoE activity)